MRSWRSFSMRLSWLLPFGTLIWLLGYRMVLLATGCLLFFFAFSSVFVKQKSWTWTFLLIDMKTHEFPLTAQVLFLGACLQPGEPVMFVTEYMPKGSRENGQVSNSQTVDQQMPCFNSLQVMLRATWPACETRNNLPITPRPWPRQCLSCR